MDGALVASASSSSTAAPTGKWTYDVFLSFRGEDTRKHFVDHLYEALNQAGIYTFKDDEKLQRGKSISPELVKAIQESMVAVVVFSKNYANSSWCLEEVAKIIECWHTTGLRVLLVFYDVDPSDVRGQKGSFHETFKQHEVNLTDDMEKVKRWREALRATASLSGWDVPRTASGHEAECIKQIVRYILSYAKSRPAESLIRIESHVRHVNSLLAKGSSDVCIIGIWGMGGIGKTTIARAVYRQISNEFEGSSFVEDVRENDSDKRGLKSLQEKLLSEILMEEHFKVKDCDDGICQIRRRLGRKKVLVVLDDVDNFKQLEFLAGAHEWFGPGSRIMVTTRDKHLLCDAQEKYEPELLRETEAMKLFCRHAFKANIPPKAYEKLSRAVVSHSGHLPLALKVLGSHFCGRILDFWESALNVLTKIPHKEISGILKLSYDGLNILEKKILLHIACFFKGKKRRYVTRILDGCGFEAVSGITVLIEKSLLTISNGKLHMHDLTQNIGWYIVRECYPNKMVWVPEEIKEVMSTITFLMDIHKRSALKADGCKSLQKIGDLSDKYKWLFQISLHHCPKLLKDQESQSHVANLLMKSLVQKCAAVNHRLSIAVPGSMIPNWFSDQRCGNTIALNLPKNHQITKMIGLSFCCLLFPPWIGNDALLKIKFKASGEEKLIDRPAIAAEGAYNVWIGYMSIDFLQNPCHVFESDGAVVSFESHVHDIMECGCMVYEDDIRPMTGVGS